MAVGVLNNSIVFSSLVDKSSFLDQKLGGVLWFGAFALSLCMKFTRCVFSTDWSWMV